MDEKLQGLIGQEVYLRYVVNHQYLLAEVRGTLKSISNSDRVLTVKGLGSHANILLDECEAVEVARMGGKNIVVVFLSGGGV